MTPVLNMKTLAGIFALAAFAAPAQAAFVTLTSSGTPVLTTINPKVALSPQPTSCTNNPSSGPPTGDQIPVETQSTSLTTGKFTGLPGTAGMPGYLAAPVVSASYNLATSGVNVGTLYDRVYCKSANGTSCDASPKVFVFATRAILNTNLVNGRTFEINDIFRVTPSAATVEAGYYPGTSGTSIDTGLATKFLEYVGRTNEGLNQTNPPTRDNTHVAFRSDVNAADPERCEPYSKNSPISPWMYHQMTCANGVETTPANITFKIRVREGGEEGQPILSISTSGYVCKP